MALHRNKAHEQTDADTGLLGKLGVWLIALVLFVLVAMWAMYSLILDREQRDDPPPSPLAGSREELVAPRLFLSPEAALAETRAAEEEVLSSYGWVDPEAGWVRIPIERAMELLVERGLEEESETRP